MHSLRSMTWWRWRHSEEVGGAHDRGWRVLQCNWKRNGDKIWRMHIILWNYINLKVNVFVLYCTLEKLLPRPKLGLSILFYIRFALYIIMKKKCICMHVLNLWVHGLCMDCHSLCIIHLHLHTLYWALYLCRMLSCFSCLVW